MLDSIDDFTRSNYSRLLKMVIGLYKTGVIAQYKDIGVQALWRHDVDYSPQSAVALAKIEIDLGVFATYYFNMRSEFYNLFEPAVAHLVLQLHSMGHEIGLHFDASQSDVSTHESFEESLGKEKAIFESIFKIPLRSFSFHNPSEVTQRYTDETYCGLVNAYNSDLMSRFKYCSDSNGYWRHTPLEKFIKSEFPAICVLTHPAWWQEMPMQPRERIVRCVNGRADATMRAYDLQLEKHGRKNVR